MTNRADFDDFLDYIGAGTLIAIVLGIFLFFVSGLCVSCEVTDAAREKNFYLALENKPVDDSLVVAAAKVFKAYLLELDGKEDVSKKISSLVNFSSISSGYYANLLLKKSDKIVSAARGEIKDLSSSVSVPKWGSFFKIFLWLFFIVISLFSTISFCWKSYGDGESLMDWPWEKWWTYPCILFMLPFLLPCVLVEVIYRLKTSSFSNIRQQRNNNYRRVRVKKPSKKSRKAEQKIKKSEALVMIEAVNKEVDKSKNEYLSNCQGSSMAEKNRNLVWELGEQRRALSDIGVRLKAAQRDYACAQKKCSDFQEALKKDGRIYKNSLKDFERLRNLEHVAAVEVKGDELTIYTEVIYIKYLLAKYEIGIFKIKIDMMTERFSLENLCSTHVNGNMHPYGRSGNICWGKLNGPINNALSQKQFPSAVQYMLTALHSAKGDSPLNVMKFRKVAGI